MKNKFVFLIVILLNFQILYSTNLSNNTQIYLITIEQGKEIYSGYGHIGIYINDSENKFQIFMILGNLMKLEMYCY